MENSFYIKPENKLTEEKTNIRNAAMYIGIALIITWCISRGWSTVYFAVMAIFGYDSADASLIFQDPVVSRIVNTVISAVSFTLPFLIIPSGCGLSVAEAVSLKKPNRGSVLPSVLIAAGICGFSNIASNILLSLLTGLGVRIPEAGSVPALPSNPFGVAVMFLATVIIAPLVEEFAFRGAVLGSLRKFGDGLAITLSAALFGLVHGNLRQIPFAFLSGLVLGFIAVKSGSLWISALAHAINNGVAFVSTLLAGYLPAEAMLFVNAGMMLLLTAFLFVTVFVLSRRSDEFLKIAKAETETPESGLGIIFFTSPFIIIFVILTVIRVASTF